LTDGESAINSSTRKLWRFARDNPPFEIFKLWVVWNYLGKGGLFGKAFKEFECGVGNV
jgi:hypothetical protein